MQPASPSKSGCAPDRYFERADPELKETVDREPVCLYLETTNRCNLLC